MSLYYFSDCYNQNLDGLSFQDDEIQQSNWIKMWAVIVAGLACVILLTGMCRDSPSSSLRMLQLLGLVDLILVGQSFQYYGKNSWTGKRRLTVDTPVFIASAASTAYVWIAALLVFLTNARCPCCCFFTAKTGAKILAILGILGGFCGFWALLYIARKASVDTEGLTYQVSIYFSTLL